MRSSAEHRIAPLLVLLSVVPAASEDFTCNQEQSRQEVERLSTNGLIASIAQFPPLVTVVVDERTWRREGIDRKKLMAQTVACAIGGPKDTMLRTIIFRAKNNKQLGTFSHNELTVE